MEGQKIGGTASSNRRSFKKKGFASINAKAWGMPMAALVGNDRSHYFELGAILKTEKPNFQSLHIITRRKQISLKETYSYQLGFPAGLSCPGKSQEGPGTGRNRTGTRDPEGLGTK